MVGKSFIYIFIYTLLVGCNTQNPLNNNECESNFTMNVEAPELEMDENGYYHIEWLEGYNQTFTTLKDVTNKLIATSPSNAKFFIRSSAEQTSNPCDVGRAQIVSVL